MQAKMDLMNKAGAVGGRIGASTLGGAAGKLGALGGIGLWILYQFVNALTMWLTLATFVGYAIIYTVILKPMTPPPMTK